MTLVPIVPMDDRLSLAVSVVVAAEAPASVAGAGLDSTVGWAAVTALAERPGCPIVWDARSRTGSPG